MVLEIDIEQEIVRRAKLGGYASRKLKWIGRKSAMDRVFFGHGRAVFMEIKRPGKGPRELQYREIGRLSKKYTDIHVVDNVEDAIRVLGVK